MNLPRFSVARPVFTSMVTLIVVILGAVSLLRLRIDMLPAIELPNLTITTDYDGASPEVVERLVTQIIEEVVATVPGVKELTSTSSEGRSQVQVSFVWGTDIDIAAQDVRSRLEDELNEMPEGIERPQLRKFDIASFPVVVLGISSDLDPVELTELIDKQVRDRFARVAGVAQVDMWGGYEREVRIELDAGRIRALGLPLDAVLSAIRDSNIDLPTGEIEQGRYEVTLRAPAEFTDLDQIRHTVVTVREGAAVTLGQIAEVRDTYRKLTRIVRVNGERGLRVAIRKQADANTVEVSKAVLAEIERTNADFPQIHVAAVINQGNFIERSITNVANSVLYGGALAVFVLLFFLRNLRSTLVISLSIPISIVATFALIFFGGFTLNLMTLGGLALGVGMMVDSSIVVLENIFRWRDERGARGAEAAVGGASEVSGAIIASTITTLVIFLPLVFVQGVSGLLFRELAYVIAFALLCSLLVSLSLVPMLASKLIRDDPLRAEGATPGLGARLAALATAAFTSLDDAYASLLGWVLRHRLLTICVALAALGASLLLAPLLKREFMPPSDEGEVRIEGRMEVGTRLSLLDQQTRKIEAIVMPAVPEIDSAVASVGPGRGGEGDLGELRLSLVPASQRTRSNTAIAADLRQRLESKVPGMTIRTRAPQGQFLLNRIIGSDEGLTIEIRGFELETLSALAEQVKRALAGIEGVEGVESDTDAGIPQEMIRFNRDKAADLGLTLREVARALETSVAGRAAGEYRASGNSYRILVQLKDAEQLSLDEILDMAISSPAGEIVALRNLMEVDPGRGPVLVRRKNQQRQAKVTADVVGRDMGSVAVEVQAALRLIPRPEGYELRVAGNFEEQERAFDELILSLVLALVLVYMVLACQYESLREPLIVMLSVPLAAIGVLVTLFMSDTSLNVQSYIGCIMLGGIVVNNAILLVDQAGQLRAEGYATMAAVTEAGRRRLRPILMTTLTTILGLIPLALGIGEGADAQAPLARAVIGGLTGSTLITLVLIPAVFSLFHPQADPSPEVAPSPEAEASPEAAPSADAAASSANE